MLVFRLVITNLLILSVGGTVTTYGNYTTSTLEAFKKLFPGRYDNGNQRACAEALHESRLPTRLHCVISDANIPFLKQLRPAISSETFFIEQFRNNDPGDIYRRRVYHVMTSGEQLVMKVYHLVNGSRFRNANYRPGLLESVQASDLEYSPGCDILWDRRGEQRFVSTMLQDKCISRWNGIPILARDRNILTPAFMTMDFQFYKPANLELVGTSKFNLTRQQADVSLASLPDVLAALQRGQQLRLAAAFGQTCPHIGRALSTPIQDFSYIKRPRVGGKLMARVRWFEGKQEVNTRMLTLDIRARVEGGYKAQIFTDRSFYCNSPREKLSLYASSPFLTVPLGNHGDVQRAVMAGDRMTFFIDYRQCVDPVAGILWDEYVIGGQVKNAYIDSDGTAVFHAIPPFDQAAYNECRPPSCPVHHVRIYPSGEVTIYLRVQRPNLDETVIRNCHLYGQHPGGAVKMYSVSGSGKPTICIQDAETPPTEEPAGGAVSMRSRRQGLMEIVVVLALVFIRHFRW